MPFIKNISVQKSKSAAAPAGSNCAVAGGTNFSLNLYANGRVWTWGINGNGQLGDGTVIASRITPVSVAGAVKTFCTITGGDVHTLAIDKSGRAWVWGLNTFGQLGDNTVASRRSPVSVAGAVKTFCKIAAGSSFTSAIDKNGLVWAWGNNNFGQLGDNTIVSKRTPVSVAGTLKTFCQIATGASHTTAIDKNGLVWAWGLNTSGQLGDNTVVSKRTPVSVAGTLKTFCQISAGFYHTLAIDKNGRAWAWGQNSSGQLGDNTITSRITPVSVDGAVKTFCKIDAGGCYTMAIDKNGQVWCWGLNTSGQIGDNTIVSKRTPVSIAGARKTFCQIAAGDIHALAIDKNGNTWAWGGNSNGQLGVNINGSSKLTPISIAGTAKTFCDIIAGSVFAAAISNVSGKVWAWGLNSSGQLGDNTLLAKITPVSIVGTNVFCKIAAGVAYVVAIDQSGLVWGWGSNVTGQLGDNTVTNRDSPVDVAGTAKTFCQIGAGNSHTIAIDQYGQVWAWGGNTNGQLGDNTIISKRTPVSVGGAKKTFCSIGTGHESSHNVAIDNTGKDLWAWGGNSSGQLGDRTTTNKCTPVKVCYPAPGLAWPNEFYNGKIALSANHTVAIDDNGQAWAWGTNTAGQLGDNTIVAKSTPVAIAGASKQFCQIAAGNSFTLAIDISGQVWAWGVNNFGQLGDNTVASRRTPVSIAGAVKTFCKIAAGNAFSTAIEWTGKVWSWGTNSSGQLGDNTLYRTTPVRVCNI